MARTSAKTTSAKPKRNFFIAEFAPKTFVKTAQRKVYVAVFSLRVIQYVCQTKKLQKTCKNSSLHRTLKSEVERDSGVIGDQAAGFEDRFFEEGAKFGGGTFTQIGVGLERA